MQIQVLLPNFDDDFLHKVNRATKKGCSFNVECDGDLVNVLVKSDTRTVGRFHFVKDEEGLIMDSKLIVEREFCPLEFAISELVKWCKRRKIRYILWN